FDWFICLSMAGLLLVCCLVELVGCVVWLSGLVGQLVSLDWFGVTVCAGLCWLVYYWSVQIVEWSWFFRLVCLLLLWLFVCLISLSNWLAGSIYLFGLVWFRFVFC
ncbi:MAG: hypothetical protein VXX80_10975, partial [Bacteroidota bacterium]|nr:hypothetical protein [Bacteroidota bacterium]